MLSVDEQSAESLAGAQWLRRKADELRTQANRSHREQLLYLAMSYERLARIEEVRAQRVPKPPAAPELVASVAPRHFSPLMPPPLPAPTQDRRTAPGRRRTWLRRCLAVFH